MRCWHYAACFVVSLALASPALAQEPLPVPAAPSDANPDAAAPEQPPESRGFFRTIGGDFKNFFRRDTAYVLGITSVATIAVVPWDRRAVYNGFDLPPEPFESGNVMGSFAFQVAVGAATYGIGRAADNGKLAAVGRDIVRGQIVSQAFAQAVKFIFQRQRPDQSNSQSFPSGHSASAFATAGVLRRHYGWKAGVPAYAFGTFVALGRVTWNKHHLSDVVAGAGLGIASARTVTMKVGGSTFNLGVRPQAGGASVNFTKAYQ